MSTAASAAAVVLAVVFLAAAVAKLVRHRETVAAFEALSLPAPAALSMGVPIAEGVVVIALLAAPRVGGALALAMLAAFSAVLVRAVLAHQQQVGCGCFGARHPSPIGPADVIRNGVLAALAVIATGTHHLVVPR